MMELTSLNKLLRITESIQELRRSRLNELLPRRSQLVVHQPKRPCELRKWHNHCCLDQQWVLEAPWRKREELLWLQLGSEARPRSLWMIEQEKTEREGGCAWSLINWHLCMTWRAIEENKKYSNVWRGKPNRKKSLHMRAGEQINAEMSSPKTENSERPDMIDDKIWRHKLPLSKNDKYSILCRSKWPEKSTHWHRGINSWESKIKRPRN